MAQMPYSVLPGPPPLCAGAPEAAKALWRFACLLSYPFRGISSS